MNSSVRRIISSSARYLQAKSANAFRPRGSQNALFLKEPVALTNLRFYYIKTTAMTQTKHKDVSSLVSPKGEFVRNESAFRKWITGFKMNTILSAGRRLDEMKSINNEFGRDRRPDGSSGFKPEKGRYHLYVSLACPWAHRTLITRKLKGLEDVISYTVVDFLMGNEGWVFNEKVDQCANDPIFGAKRLRDVYHAVSPGYDGRITVPVLFDKQTKQIVNNESSEILRMLTSVFDEFCATDAQRAIDLYPKELRPAIDAVNEWVYPYINNGVYRCGFGRSQEAYDKAVDELFENLDKVEEVLSKSRYLIGDRLTEADVRLFTTLVRFDQVYHGHFKCNKKMIKDYPNLWGYLRDLFQTPGFGDSTDFNHIRKHYMMSHVSINPYGIVSIGPDLDFDFPHGRDTKFTK